MAIYVRGGVSGVKDWILRRTAARRGIASAGTYLDCDKTLNGHIATAIFTTRMAESSLDAIAG